MEDWLMLFRTIDSLTCTTRRKAEHKYNSSTFQEAAKLCAEMLTNGGAAALQFELAVEDYKKAANQDYELYTAKDLSLLASRAKRELKYHVNAYYRDSALA